MEEMETMDKIWTALSGELPPSGKRVLFSWLNSQGKRRTSIGFYAAYRDIIVSDDEENPEDEDCELWGDAVVLREGWYEEGAEEAEYEAGYCFRQKTPTHWMSLPPPPEKEHEDKV